MDTKNYFSGLDILKFILAILIVAGHTSFGLEFRIYPLLGIIESIAVPCFFMISAFLFFNKLNIQQINQRHVLRHSIKRLCLIFGIWYIIMLPMTYHTFFKLATIKEIIYAFLFTCSFSGYWFFKALIVNTIILYFFRGEKKLTLISIIALIIHLFWFYNYKYAFISLAISPYYSFYYHTIYFSVGALLAHYYKKSTILPNTFLFLGLIITYIIALNFPSIDFIYKLLFPLFIIILFIRFNPIYKPIYKYMRNISILLYVTHFILIWGYKLICIYYLNPTSNTYTILQYSVIRFIIVISIALGISIIILKLEKKPALSFLKKLH